VKDDSNRHCRLPEQLRRYALASDWQRDEQDRDRRRRALEELGTRSRS
jgi:hypothetical protein